jgi:hypothetical protein
MAFHSQCDGGECGQLGSADAGFGPAAGVDLRSLRLLLAFKPPVLFSCSWLCTARLTVMRLTPRCSATVCRSRCDRLIYHLRERRCASSGTWRSQSHDAEPHLVPATSAIGPRRLGRESVSYGCGNTGEREVLGHKPLG